MLPDRFHPEIRLGRDRESELWLATDKALDRPVLARVVGPNAGPDLRRRFTEGVRAIAGVTHDHLAAVYAADETEDSAYAVTEWAGGVTIADRIGAGEPIGIDDFLANAAGLADALAKLHAADVVHGAIGPDAVLYSAAHPAKLSPFASLDGESKADTAALASTLVAGLAGGDTDLAPSQLAEGLPSSVDSALRKAKSGQLDAAGLAAALRAAPSPSAPTPGPRWSWRWLGIAAALFVVALIVVVLGFALEADSDSALLYPVGEPAPLPTSPAAAPATEAPTVAAPEQAPDVVAVETFDPFGDGEERDRDVDLLVDGSTSTTWRTERYFDPLQLLKPGVGVIIGVEGTVGAISIDGSPGTAVVVAWSEAKPTAFDDWDQVGSAVLGSSSTDIDVEAREGGSWLIWLTEVPPQDGGEYYYTVLSEIRFTS